jgi:hypothetical protein
MKPMNFPRRKARRRLEAFARASAYARLPMSQKLAKAGKKELAKLNRRGK